MHRVNKLERQKNEILSASLAICVGNLPSLVDSTHQVSVMCSFDVLPLSSKSCWKTVVLSVSWDAMARMWRLWNVPFSFPWCGVVPSPSPTWTRRRVARVGSSSMCLRGQVVYSISQEICTRFCCALLCCGYAIVHNEFTWSIYPYSSGLLCWHWGNR